MSTGRVIGSGMWDLQLANQGANSMIGITENKTRGAGQSINN
jgi:hypothetical protein